MNEDNVEAVAEPQVNTVAEPADMPVETEYVGPGQAERDFFGDAFAAVDHYATMLCDEGELRGLIGPRELPRLWSRHLVNCGLATQFLPSRGIVGDIGSGAGFPGIVMACMRPDLEFVLIDPMERRCEWLTDVITEVGLDNVQIARARAEELHKTASFDVVTSRAVASMPKLLRFCAPLVVRKGRIVALKGKQAVAEVDSARNLFKRYKFNSVKVHEVASPVDDEVTRVVVARKA